VDRPGERHFALYALLAACAVVFRSELRILFHGFGHSNVTWTTWLPIAGAVAVFLRPTDLRALLLLYLGVALDLAHILPESPNHWLLTGIVGVSWWVAAGATGLRTGAALLRGVVGPFRVAIAVFYLFTGLWKLNDGFADPTISCGVSSWDRLVGQFPFLPDGVWVDHAVIGFTWALELVGPVLLLWRPSRKPAVVFFAFFHLVLSLDLVQNYQNFSWAMFPLLALFFDPEDVDGLPTLHELLPLVRKGAAAMFAALIPLAWFAPELWTNLRWTFSVALGAGVVAAFAGIARSRVFAPSRSPSAGAAWVLLALVVLNGISPILGIKNRNSWQMYSNVRIEDDVTNHWLLPPSLDLLGLQRDRVEVLEVGNPFLASQLVDRGLTLTWWDFRGLLAQFPETTVRWRRAGQVHEGRSGDPALAPPPRIARMFVWFRPQGELTARQCVW
jgi:hypothetical protein